MPAALKISPPEPAPETSLTFGRIGDLSALLAAKLEWDALFARVGDSRLGFQAHGWAANWARHYSASGDLNILTARSDGRLCLVWPLITRRVAGATLFEALGDPLSQYHAALVDPVVGAEAAFGAALDQLRDQGADLLRLRRVRGDGALAKALGTRGANEQRVEQAPFVDLRRGSVARGQADKGKDAANRRRRLRRLEERGPVKFEVESDPSGAALLLGEAMRMKRAWALKTGRLALAAFDDRFENAFRTALIAGDPCVKLRIGALTCGGRTIGVDIALACGDRLFGHVLTSDPEFSSLGVGVGVLLADATIRAAITEGYRIFDLLAPADDYKRAWADGEVEIFDIQLPLTRHGRWVGKALEAVDRGLRWLAPRAPLALRRAALAYSRR